MRKRAKQIITAACVVGVLVSIAAYVKINRQTANQKTVRINQMTYLVETAITTEEQTRGLSYRDQLEENRGMLFIYNEERAWQFWMNEMKFPIDVIWIAGNKVVDISPDVPDPAKTNNIPVIMSPKVPARFVLEVNAGSANKHNIQVGDAVAIDI